MYENISSPYKGEKLAVRPDNREEAFEHNKYAIGIYKKKDGDCDELVGYAPAGVLSLLYHFLQTSDDNCVEVEILGKRKLEVGLVVLLRYNACAMAKLQR